ncbi:MAG: WYL domain-containing protein, partial [Longimicrobiales bacterium]|nr:WYL domain-containing protein [Longimicrobiales bacterium]
MEPSWSWSRNEGTGIAEETKRVARILDIVVRINSRPKVWTRRALAQAYEISERRIQEDLEIVAHRLCLPLDHCRTGYFFDGAVPLPSVTFAFGEAAALILAATVGQSTVGVGGPELAAALARLKDAFPVELRRLIDDLGSSGGAAGADASRRRVLELLQEAIATRTTIQMRYATASRGDAESERAVDPYALVPDGRSFMMVGYCHTREAIRTFKVDRIQEARLLAERFDKPADFDIRAYQGEGWAMMRGAARDPELVRVHFAQRAGRWVSEVHWHDSQRLEWQPDGGLLFSVRIGVPPSFIRWLLYYGSDAKVLRPAWLAEEVRGEAA